MGTVIRNIINMIPYMIIAIPIYLIARFIFIKLKKIKVNWYHETALFIFVVFIVGLASQTIIPKFEFGMGKGIVKSGISEINLIPFKVFVDTYKEVFINGYINYFIVNFLGNIMLFIPIGFFIALLWKLNDKRVILIGFCISLFIEFCQLFLNRGTDVDDLILNTVGTILGLLLYKFLNKKFNKFISKFR